MAKHSEVMFTNVISNFQPIFRAIIQGHIWLVIRFAILCKTAQAPMCCKTLTGSIRISECMRWNLLLKIPNNCLIFTLVFPKASLKPSRCCVLGWGQGVIRKSLQPYPLSPIRKPSSKSFISSFSLSQIRLSWKIKKSCENNFMRQ